MKTNSTATIADVAREAGVSTATVSRLINGIGPVSEHTEERVREAIRDLRYTPKRKRKSKTPSSDSASSPRSIAFLRIGDFNSADRSPVTEHLVESLHRNADALGCNLTVHHVPDLEGADVRKIVGDAEGVLLRTSNIHEVTRESVGWLNGVPTVQVLGVNRGGRLWVDHVTPDNAQAGTLAAEYLIEQGCERLVFAAPTLICGVGLERCISFVQTGCEAGKDVRVLLQSSQSTPEGGHYAFERDLAGYPVTCKVLKSRVEFTREIASINPDPFGLFIPTDLELAMVIPQLQMLGVDFQKGSHAIGCDHETRCFSGLDSMPATMDLHLENIAARAIRRLIYRIQHPNEPLVRIAVSPNVVPPDQVLISDPEATSAHTYSDMVGLD